MASPQPQQQSKDFDFNGFFSNPIVAQFLTQLLKSVLGIFKGDVGKDLEEQIKTKGSQLLSNLDTITDPKFVERLMTTQQTAIVNAINTKMDMLNKTIETHAAKPEAMKKIASDAISSGLNENLSTELQAALSNVSFNLKGGFNSGDNPL